VLHVTLCSLSVKHHGCGAAQLQGLCTNYLILVLVTFAFAVHLLLVSGPTGGAAGANDLQAH
jgi:hypothetical protein